MEQIDTFDEVLELAPSPTNSDDDFVVVKSGGALLKLARKELTNENKALQESNRRLDEQVVSLIQELDQYKKLAKESELAIEHLNRDLVFNVDGMQNVITVLKDDLDAKKDEVKKCKEELEQVEEENESLKQQLKDRDIEVCSLNCMSAEKEELIKELKSKIVTIEADLRCKDSTLGKVLNQNADIEAENKHLKEQIHNCEVEKRIVDYKKANPTLSVWEIRDRLLTDGVCDARNIPSLISITKLFRKINEETKTVSSVESGKEQLELLKKQFEEEKLLLKQTNETQLETVLCEKEKEWQKKFDEMSQRLVSAAHDYQKLTKNNQKLENEIKKFNESKRLFYDDLKQMLMDDLVKREAEKQKEQKQTKKESLVGTEKENANENNIKEVNFPNPSSHQIAELIKWKPAANGYVGPDGVAGGNERDGNHITFIGRATMHGNTLPGKIVKELGLCYFVHMKQEHQYADYEYLVKPKLGKLTWKPESNGRVPTGAVVGGKCAGEEQLFVIRANYNGHLIIGKLQPSRIFGRISWEGRAISVHQYEVLCLVFD